VFHDNRSENLDARPERTQQDSNLVSKSGFNTSQCDDAGMNAEEKLASQAVAIGHARSQQEEQARLSPMRLWLDLCLRYTGAQCWVDGAASRSR
jgi:hypothetical protein